MNCIIGNRRKRIWAIMNTVDMDVPAAGSMHITITGAAAAIKRMPAVIITGITIIKNAKF